VASYPKRITEIAKEAIRNKSFGVREGLSDNGTGRNHTHFLTLAWNLQAQLDRVKGQVSITRFSPELLRLAKLGLYRLPSARASPRRKVKTCLCSNVKV
jgi:hypothetical protein